MVKKVRDVETGELHVVGIVRKERHKELFTMMFTKPLLEALDRKNAKLTALELRVLLTLWAECDYGNTIEFLVKDLAADAGGHRVDVGRAVKQLEQWDFLRRTGGRRGGEGRYLLNPDLTFRGLPKQRRQAQAAWRELS